MACDNSLTKNNPPNKPQRIRSNVHFDDISEKSPEQNWQHKDTKCKHSIFAQKHKPNNFAAWQIDSLKKLLAEIEKDFKGILSMILDMQSIYIKYLNKANKADKKRDEIHTCALGLEHELYISNKKREQTVSLLQQ